jgi:hypothetical protein
MNLDTWDGSCKKIDLKKHWMCSNNNKTKTIQEEVFESNESITWND